MPIPTAGDTPSAHPAASRSAPVERTGEVVRALFISDVHLGSPHACADEFLALLHRYQPERLYLVGDIIDGRRLRQSWRWPKVYNEIVSRISDLLSSGTKLFYAPGNHDEFIRELLPSLPPIFRSDRIHIADEFLYESRRNARLLITHGDQFDHHEKAAGLVSATVTVIYDWILKIDGVITKFRNNHGRRAASRWAKGQIGPVQKFWAEFEQTASTYAERAGYDGIICGHIHCPKIVSRDSISYCNTGDWVEHCSALIEHTTGDWELSYFNPQQYAWAENSACEQASKRSSTWWAKPSGEDVHLTLLKSNRWTHRHSFPALNPESKPLADSQQAQPASGNQSDAASQQEKSPPGRTRPN